MTGVVCRGASAAIMVYDITSADSFARSKAWVRELQRQGNPNMIMALAGELGMPPVQAGSGDRCCWLLPCRPPPLPAVVRSATNIQHLNPPSPHPGLQGTRLIWRGRGR